VWRLIALPLSAVPILLAAEKAQGPYEAVRAAMEASISRQKESVRRQVSAGVAADGWFTVPWPEAVAAGAGDADCPPIPPHELRDYIDAVAKREGFTPDLLRAVIDRESGFRPCAVSSKGAQGLMQLMPETAAGLGVEDPFDARQNIAAGARFLSQLLEKYHGDIVLALAAYNAGPARVDRYQGLPPIPETLDYVAGILKKLRVDEPEPTAGGNPPTP
jgi:soluble lytic murein transglycosylase-like protein